MTLEGKGGFTLFWGGAAREKRDILIQGLNFLCVQERVQLFFFFHATLSVNERAHVPVH
jgi:hypothetical protein